MRTFLSGLLTLIAMAAIVVAVPSVWVQYRLIDADGFVSTISPMAQNEKVQNYLADEIATRAAEQTGVSFTSALVRPVARAYTHSAQFQADFADIVSQQHAWLFNAPPPGSDTSVMQLDITDMVNRVIAQTKINVTVAGPIQVPLANGANGFHAGRYHDVGQQITRLAYASVIIAVITGLLALVIARRRGTVLAFLGLGGLIAGVLTWGSALYFADRAKHEVDAAQGTGRDVANVIIDATANDLQHVSLVVCAVGAGVIVVGILIAAASSRARRR